MKFKAFYTKYTDIGLLESNDKKFIFKQVNTLDENNKETLRDKLKRKYGIEEFEKRDGSDVYSIGFSPKNKKWWGWSHRAIYGFGIGSKVKLGDCGYKPSNKEEFHQKLREWYDKDDMYKNVEYKFNRNGVKIKYEIHPKKSKEILKSEVFERYPNKWGRGEWTAKTLKDAKEMAVDFAESVS